MEYVKLGELCTFRQGTQVPIEEQIFDIKQNYVRFLRIIDYTQENEPPRYVINN